MLPHQVSHQPPIQLKMLQSSLFIRTAEIQLIVTSDKQRKKGRWKLLFNVKCDIQNVLFFIKVEIKQTNKKSQMTKPLNHISSIKKMTGVT